MTKEKGLVKGSAWTKEQVELITRTVAKGATMDELGLFFNVAKRAKLDPFLRQIHLVARNTKMPDGTYATVRTVQVGIDGFRAIAERTKQYAGSDDAIFDEGAKYEPGKEPKNPTKATVTVYRIVKGQRVGYTASARWKEYYPGGKQGYMWDKMPYSQLAKCAEALALRKAFPADLSGLYTHEEMEQAGQEASPVREAIAVDAEIVEPTVACHGCGVEISKQVAEYSNKLYGIPFCRECQKGAEKIK